MPARFWPPTLTAVSNAPQSSPLAYITSCMRESLEFSEPLGGPKVALLWLLGARPATAELHVGRMTVSAMQVPSGRSPAGCVALGGSAYCKTTMEATSIWGLGLAVFSDE